ncbi:MULTISPECIES: PaaI family thioesterase [Vitreoscilla]|uniref:PaaI family thioesterase n=1 Tax=Vitreoscilla stercoraria TaxID=61 RepID=A0ABY4EAB6_VITST|nr:MULTISPECIES: PaaI family thioesterase [Vitreoscilla]AUZ05927.1 hypothetical protein ADP71_26400 [Vitreoscilla sp. C1]UOO92701.1 PaaI family thioesterase [Vitreoscilla stercoraria]
MTEPVNLVVYEALKNHYVHLPHCKILNLQFEHTIHRSPTLSVGWREDLMGNSSNQVIHGGVITTLVDVASATAVAAHLPEFETLATLDMRIDYLHAATPKQRIYATSDCYRLSGQVAFVHTTCYHDNQIDHPIALGMATFMRTPIPAHLKAYIHKELAL